MKLFLQLSIVLFFISFISCKDNKNSSAVEKSVTSEPKWEEIKGEYINKSKDYVKNSGSTLKARLLQAIENGGFENAITVCNKVAQNMIDSISTAEGVKIKRTSLNFRNVLNTPDQYDIDMLKKYNTLKAEGKEIAPEAIELENNQVKVYMPIIAEKLCLQCHGTIGQDISPNVAKLIKKLYPDDKATGYKEGDIRGTWVVEMEK